MSCRNIAWKVGPFIDGELPPSEREEVQSHLAACAECADMARAFHRLDESAARDRPPPVSGEEWTRLWESILERRGAAGVDVDDRVLPFPAGARWKRRTLAALAAAAIFLLGLFLGLQLQEKPPAPGPGLPGPVAVPIERRDGGAESPPTRPQDPGLRRGEKIADFAELLSGPEPDISVEDDVTTITYPNF